MWVVFSGGTALMFVRQGFKSEMRPANFVEPWYLSNEMRNWTQSSCWTATGPNKVSVLYYMFRSRSLIQGRLSGWLKNLFRPKVTVYDILALMSRVS